MDAGQLRLGGGPAGGTRIENAGTFVMAGDTRLVARSCCIDPSVFANEGRLEKRGSPGDAELWGVFVQNAGTVEVAQGRLVLSAGAEFGQSVGEMVLASAAAVAAKSVTMAGGALRGGGRIEGTLSNVAGEISPGQGTGKLTVTGDFMQGRAGILRLELGGLVAGTESDLLEVTGTARLDGERTIATVGAFRPALGEAVEVIRYGQRRGVFARVTGLDLAEGLHLSARYEDPTQLGQPGSLRLVARPTPLPAECRRAGAAPQLGGR